MASKKSAAELADLLCTSVLELRSFGEVNSPYLTRLENEIHKKGWRLKTTRIERIHEELTDRSNQLTAMVTRLRAALTSFGRLSQYDTDLLDKYWTEAMRIQNLFESGVRDITIKIPAPLSNQRGPGTL